MQLAFIHHKILYGMNDKDAAIAAGYAPSVAENTLQKIWAKPGVKAEFERLKNRFQAAAQSPVEGSWDKIPEKDAPITP